jgi:hypothetical protein
MRAAQARPYLQPAAASSVRLHARRVASLGALCALPLLAACSSKTIPATQLVVTVDSDLAVGSQLSRVHAQLQNADGKKGEGHSFNLVKGKPGKDEVVLPFSFGVAKGKDRELQLVVTGYGPMADEVALVERRATVSFQDGKTLELTVWLSARCVGKCLGDESTTCDGAATGADPCGPIPDAGATVHEDGAAGKDAGSGAAGGGRAGAGGTAAGSGGRSGAGAGGGGRAGDAAGSGGRAGAAAMAGAGAGALAGSGGIGAAGAGGTCAPSCAGKKCGPDGCNGMCGTCAANEKCEAGSCMCVPNCAGKRCGADGCGSTCGTCAGNDQCEGGTCVCRPNCAGKQCGPDGCGGQCPAGCPPDIFTCVSGQCKGVCGALYVDCNCDVAPSQVEGSARAEPDCASGTAILQGCSGLGCFDPNTGALVSMQWRELCGCN